MGYTRGGYQRERQGPGRGQIEAWLRRLDRSPRLRLDGRLTRFEGANHVNLHLGVEGARTLDNSRYYVLRLPGEGLCYDGSAAALARSMVREAETLRRLAGSVGEFAVPECVFFEEAAPELDGPAMLTTMCPGLPMGEKQYWRFAEAFCEEVGRALAAVHALDPAVLPHVAQAPLGKADLDRRVQKPLPKGVAGYEAVQIALQLVPQAAERVPGRTSLLHGDPMLQNFIYGFNMPGEDDSRTALVDWELADYGDPAYDFAILFRGGNKLAGIGGARPRALDAYREAGGIVPDPRRIAMHEALLSVGWLQGDPISDESQLNRLLKILHRVLDEPAA